MTRCTRAESAAAGRNKTYSDGRRSRSASDSTRTRRGSDRGARSDGRRQSWQGGRPPCRDGLDTSTWCLVKSSDVSPPLCGCDGTIDAQRCDEMRCDATRIDGARRWMRDGDEVDDGFFPIDQKPARGFSLSASVWARKNGLESPDDGLAWSVEPDARHANGGCGLRETMRGAIGCLSPGGGGAKCVQKRSGDGRRWRWRWRWRATEAGGQVDTR